MVGMSISRDQRGFAQSGIFPVLLACSALLFAVPGASAQDAESGKVKVAVFDFELIDSSLEGEMMGKNPAEQARLKTMAPQLAEDIGATEEFELVDIAPVRERAEGQRLQSCGGCARTFAEELGADVAVTGTVQKVSNLILNINAYAYDVGSGRAIAQGSADIRSNSDESWDRGIQYLWENTISKQLATYRDGGAEAGAAAPAPDSPDRASQGD